MRQKLVYHPLTAHRPRLCSCHYTLAYWKCRDIALEIFQPFQLESLWISWRLIWQRSAWPWLGESCVGPHCQPLGERIWSFQAANTFAISVVQRMSAWCCMLFLPRCLSRILGVGSERSQVSSKRHWIQNSYWKFEFRFNIFSFYGEKAFMTRWAIDLLVGTIEFVWVVQLLTVYKQTSEWSLRLLVGLPFS